MIMWPLYLEVFHERDGLLGCRDKHLRQRAVLFTVHATPTEFNLSACACSGRLVLTVHVPEMVGCVEEAHRIHRLDLTMHV